MQLKNNIKKLSLISVIGAVLLTSGCTTPGSDTAAQTAYKPVTLTVWRAWDDTEAFSQLVADYRKVRPNVTVEYRRLRYEEYEKTLLQAFAEDRGPDVFSINNTWMRKYEPMLADSPDVLKIPTKTIQGSIKKEEVFSYDNVTSITPAGVRKTFLDVVGGDVLWKKNVGTEKTPKISERVWGLPLSMDALVLYYNKDLLANAGIVTPATTWTDFTAQAQKMTKFDESTGNILISGAAIGTSTNVTRDFDIVSLLMMQNLAPMLDENGQASFNKRPPEVAEGIPALGVLEYYTQFASPLYPNYSWNDKMPESLDAFINGQVGYFLGYNYQRATIEARAPKLKFDIAPVPQVGPAQKVNYANYWVEVVSKKTKNKDYAWDFIQFAAKEENALKFVTQNSKPTALRSAKIINLQLADEKLDSFAEELLTTASWYKGKNATDAEAIFGEMITSINKGEIETAKALTNAVDRVNQSIR
jgi:ABC-type glycerol-3-phosphate transport system substrate-binding protein